MSDPISLQADAIARFRLDGRVAFLSGATGHLGRAMAAAMAGAGAHVVLNARNADALEGLAKTLQDQGQKVSVACCDITDGEAIREQIVGIGREHGRLDVIVNNASAGRTGTIESASAEDFEQLYRVNVVASFEILQAALPLLRESARKTPAARRL